MTKVSATETLRFNVVRCDADVFGEYVDFLFGLVEPDIVAYQKTEAMHSPSSVGTLEQLRPDWKVATGRRTIHAKGLWREVRGSLDLTQALTVEVSMWSPGPGSAAISFEGGRSSAATLRVKATPDWLDQHMPRIRSESRSLMPRWGALWSRAAIWTLAGVAGALWMIAGGFAIGSASTLALWLCAASGLVLLASSFMLRVPALQLGPVPAPRWRKPATWIAGAVVAAVIGAVITRLYDNISPPTP